VFLSSAVSRQLEIHSLLTRSSYHLFRTANRILAKATDPNTKDVPKELFQQAEGLIIFSVVEAGIGISVKSGRGILMCKQHGGTWSNPAAFDLSEFAFGLSAGVSGQDVIMFIKDPLVLTSLVRDYYGHTDIGHDATGTLGDHTITDGDHLDDFKVKSVVFSNGAFLGLKSKWGGMRCPESENQRFYGSKATPKKIILGEVPFPTNKETEIDQVYEKIAKLSAV